MTVPNPDVMTIAEARKLLGKEAKNYTDEQVGDLVVQLDFLAGLAIESYKKSKLKKQEEAGASEHP